MPNERTENKRKAMEMRHQHGMPLDAIATRLGITATEARDLVFGPPRKPLKRTAAKRWRQSISPASPQQRQKVKGEVCVVSGCHSDECAPAHVIDRSLLADRDNDPLRVVPLCTRHHREYDEGTKGKRRDLLPDLEREAREELGHAVTIFGLLSTLQRVTGSKWQPVPNREEP